MIDFIRTTAKENGYAGADFKAALEFKSRRDRVSNPPGSFDKAGRFYADENTDTIRNSRSPSRAYPYSQMNPARTAKHCAEVFGATALHVRRIARALDLAEKSKATNHEKMAFSGECQKILKKVKITKSGA